MSYYIQIMYDAEHYFYLNIDLNKTYSNILVSKLNLSVSPVTLS